MPRSSDQEYSALELGPIGKIESGFTNGVAWEKSSILGRASRPATKRTKPQREALFDSQVGWRKAFPKAETLGSESVNGEDCLQSLADPSYRQTGDALLLEEIRTAAEDHHNRSEPHGGGGG